MTSMESLAEMIEDMGMAWEQRTFGSRVMFAEQWSSAAAYIAERLIDEGVIRDDRLAS